MLCMNIPGKMRIFRPTLSDNDPVTSCKMPQIPGGNKEERLLNFHNQAKQNPHDFKTLMDFIIFQKERVLNGEIEASTISIYYNFIMLFCNVNDLLINWKFISRGIPKGKHASDNRLPTLE
jgi:hypothetical protein